MFIALSAIAIHTRVLNNYQQKHHIKTECLSYNIEIVTDKATAQA